jgi:hypothetical protein
LTFWRDKKNRTDRDLSIVRQRRLMKAFAAIKFKAKMDDAIMFSELFSVRMILVT